MNHQQIETPFSTRRRSLCCAGLSLFFISACEAKPMTATLDVVLFSYLDRPIFEVMVGNHDIGVAGPYPYSGRGTMTGMRFQFGPQKISWTLDGPEGMVDNGKVVNAINTPELKDIPSKTKYLSVHIYPDNMVEFVFSQNFPGLSLRGEKFNIEWERLNGK